MADRILILDGGMGTTLEDEFSADISSTLWSSTLLSTPDGQETLSKLHLAFLEAGADLIETCTYQSSVDKFKQNGYGKEEAVELMRRAVRLTSDSISNFSQTSSSSSSTPSKPQTVLSLSCYGAMCTPGQEYAGDYPAPYGPPHSPGAEEALTQWHYERLLVFAEDSETWSRIDMIAFETVPLLSEGMSIRKAMHMLKQTLQAAANGEQHWPDWWISFVFSEKGKLPVKFNGDLPPEQIAKEMFTLQIEAELPTGLGINCTKLRFLPRIVEGFTQALREQEGTQQGKAPWLVLYPDGGLTYDVNTRTWHSGSGAAEGESQDPASAWAEELYRIGSSALQEQVKDGQQSWGKVVLGGCCKASPDYISKLSKIVKDGKVVGV